MQLRTLQGGEMKSKWIAAPTPPPLTLPLPEGIIASPSQSFIFPARAPSSGRSPAGPPPSSSSSPPLLCQKLSGSPRDVEAGGGERNGRKKAFPKSRLTRTEKFGARFRRRGSLGVDRMGWCAPHLLLTCFLKTRFTSLLWRHKTAYKRVVQWRLCSQNNDESFLSSLMRMIHTHECARFSKT